MNSKDKELRPIAAVSLLLVDDEKKFLEVYSGLLRQLGCRVSAHFDPDWPLGYFDAGDIGTAHTESRAGSVRVFPLHFDNLCIPDCGTRTIFDWSVEDQNIMCIVLHEVGHEATATEDDDSATYYAEVWYQAIRRAWNSMMGCVDP